MPRPRVLTDEQRLENKKNLDTIPITLNVNQRLKEKIDKISSQYRSRNACIIDLIKTHPDFIKQFKKIS